MQSGRTACFIFKWPTSLCMTQNFVLIIKCTRFLSPLFLSLSVLSLHKWKSVANEKGFEEISSFKSFAGGKICRNQNWYAFQVLINSDRIFFFYLDKCRHRLHFSCNLSKTRQSRFFSTMNAFANCETCSDVDVEKSYIVW